MMNWEAIGALGEILGALAVIGTLVYLARQIGQSVSIARASQNRSLMESYEGINDLVLGNAHLIDALKGIENPERGRERADSVLIRHLMYRWFNVWLSAELSFANGQLSLKEFEIYKDDFKNVQDVYPGLMPYLIEELERYPSAKSFEIFAPISAQM
jgi:hypothetical protein